MLHFLLLRVFIEKEALAEQQAENSRMDIKTFKIKILPIKDKLFRQALKTVGNDFDAEDVVQEVMLKLWDLRRELETVKNPEAYAMSMVKNASINKIRDRKQVSDKFYETIQDTNKNPDRQLENKDAVEIVSAIIENLPYMQQMIIKLRDIECLSIEEIADITGSETAAIRVNLSRARKKVKEIFLKINNIEEILK